MIAVDITDILAGICTDMGLTLTYGTRFEQNFDSDNATYPKVYLDEPMSSREKVQSSGNTSLIYSVKLFFADKSSLDYTPPQQRIIIQQQRTKVKEFIQRLMVATYNNNLPIFESLTGVEFLVTDVVNLPYDVGLTGVFVEVDLPIINYGGLCLV